MDLLISIPITICLIILVHHLRAIHLRRQKNLPPGQYGLPLIGETLQLMSAFKSDNPQPFIEKRVARFGLIFTTHLFGEPTVFSVDPDFNLFVLQNEFKLFESSYPTSISKLVGKHSLLLMKDGNLHKRLHTLTITFAGNANIRDHLFGDIESMISSFLNFADGKIFLLEETKKIAFALTVKLLMSIEPCEWSTSLEKEYLHLIGGFFALPLPFIYTTYNRAMKAREIVAEQLTSVVKQRRRENEQGNKKKDIIGALLHEESGRRGGKEFSDEEIADFLVAILVAGLETTSSSMAIAIKLLTDTPLALAQLKDEQDKIKAKRNGRALNWEDYKSMVFTQCEERAQRLFDHLIDQQLLIFPKIDNADLEGVCKWHMTELHTTDKCPTFRAFVARLVQKGKLPLLPIDGEALDLGSKEKILEAMKGKSVKIDRNSDSKTYKDVLEADPAHSRLIQSMKNLRRNMCFGCADILHFELVRIQAIPNDPKWITAYQRRSMKRVRELEAGVSSK